MPITVVNATASIAGSLGSVSMTGSQVANYARGIATGLTTWVAATQVVTSDVGTAGVGKNIPSPVVVTAPVLYANLVTGFASQAMSGTSVPSLCLGLSNGLVLALAQGLINTVHPTVGVGTGVAKFVAPSAIPFMSLGLASAGMSGTAVVSMASALGMALDLTFASLVLPIAIVGPTSPYAGVGVGTGKIL